jgi:zinc-binding alcohol dehydrogenase/oxidoreductase
VQAVVVREWGGPEVLRCENVPDPVPAAGEALVEVRASAVNWHDILVRRAGRDFALPSILGMDGAGVRRDSGDEVIILPALNWGDRREAPGPAFGFLGDATDGTHAELISAPVANLFPKPVGWSWAEAAALPTAGVTAYRALFTRARTQPGETVLVIGAGGGVSTFAISLAAAAGARVLVSSSSPDKIERALALGADGGVTNTSQGWVEELASLSAGGVDVVVDGVGAGMSDALACLRPGGRLAVFGARGGTAAEIDVPQLYFSQHSILATSIGDAHDFGELLTSIKNAAWRPVLDSVRPLAELRTAHERIEAGQHFGKLVLRHNS